MFILNQKEKEVLEQVYYIPMAIDAAYINSLVDLVNACRVEGVELGTVCHFQNGWHVTFKGFNGADAICHDHSYGSPNYVGAFLGDENPNDWSRTGEWETIGFPWDDDSVSVHDATTLAHMLKRLSTGEEYSDAWEDFC